VIGDAPVIFEGFGAHGLVVQRGHGDVPISSSSGVVKNTMLWGSGKSSDHAALVDENRAHAAFLELDAARETGGARAYNHDIEAIHYSIPSTLV